MAGSAGNQEGSGAATESASALRELAVRLLRERYPGDAVEADDTTLLVGALPTALPIDIPLPDGCRVLGSTIRAHTGLTAILDCVQPAEQIFAFYTERMIAAGWTVLDVPRHGGFGSDGVARRLTLCSGARDPALIVQAVDIANKPTEVQLTLQTDPRYSPCRQRRSMRMRSLIPPLSSPPNSQVLSVGSGGGGESWRSDASLKSDISVVALAAHYVEQLEHAGWVRTGAGQDARMSWSTWSLHDEDDEPWRGFLVILTPPDSTNEHFLSIRIDPWEAHNTRVLMTKVGP